MRDVFNALDFWMIMKSIYMTDMTNIAYYGYNLQRTGGLWPILFYSR